MQKEQQLSQQQHKATVKVTVKAREIPTIENGIYFEKPAGWGDTIYAYAWTESNGTTVHLGAWPGTTMKELEDGLYGLSFKHDEANTQIIFVDGNGHQTADLEFKNSGLYNVSGLVQIVDPNVEKGKVTVEYVDVAGNILSVKTLSGKIGSSYETEAMNFDGYTLFQTSANKTGKYTKEDITVVYIYTKNNSVPEIMASLSVSDTTVKVGDKITLTASAKGGQAAYKYTYYYEKNGKEYVIAKDVSSKTYTWTASSGGIYKFYVKADDGVSLVSNPSSKITVTVENEVIPIPDLQIEANASATSSVVGDKITFTAHASWGNGEYRYSYIVHNKTTDEWVRLADKISSNTYTWEAKSAGTREFFVEVTDGSGRGRTARSAGIIITTTKPVVLSATAKASATNVAVDGKVTFTVMAKGGDGSYKYSYIVYNKTTKKWARLADKKASSTYTWEAKSAGTRVFYVDVTDASGKTVRTTGITVTTPDKTPLSAVAKASAKNITVNDKVTFTATAKGGDGSYKYSYIVHNKTTGEWLRLVDKSSSNTYTWTAKSAGTREFYVDVTDKSGKTVRCNVLTVVTTKSESLQSIASVTDSSIAVGDTTVVIGTAFGGSGAYKYSFVVYNETKDSWYRYDFNTSNILSWKATSKGVRKIYVEVKDSLGKVVRSSSVRVTVK